MALDGAAALAVSCLIGLFWFDELWACGEAAGFWVGEKISGYIFGDDQ